MAIRLGVVTDLHYARGVREGTRQCGRSLYKLRQAVTHFRRERCAALVVLGDIIDTAPDAAGACRLVRQVAEILARFSGPVRVLAGNHCLAQLSRGELRQCRLTRLGAGAFTLGGVRLLMLDACYRGDGRAYSRGNFDWRDADVPAAQRAWLARQLQIGREPVVVLTHQRLDVGPPLGIRCHAQVRGILEKSGRVQAVLQGHEHAGDSRSLGGILYHTVPALVEGYALNPAAAIVVEIGSQK